MSKQHEIFEKKERGKSKNKEEKVQIAICKYLRLQYPNVIFTCDLASGIRLTMGQAVKHKSMRSSRGQPDLFIAHSKGPKTAAVIKEAAGIKGYHRIMVAYEYTGLFIELKRDGTPLKRPKDAQKILKGEKKLRLAGDWYDDHIEEQAGILEQLRKQGYRAEFAIGFEEAKNLIDEYMR